MIDATIPLQVRSPQFDNPMDVAAKAMTLKQLAAQGQLQQVQLDAATRQQQEQQQVADIYRTNAGTGGKVNHAAIIDNLAASGLGHMIPAYRKSMLDAEKDQQDIDLKGTQNELEQGKVTKQKLDVVGGDIAGLLQNPNVTHDDIITTIVGWNKRGLIDTQTGHAMVKAVPSDPDALRDFLVVKGNEVNMKALDVGKRLEMMTPKYQQIDAGGTVQVGSVNPMTAAFTPNQVIRKTALPDNGVARDRLALDTRKYNERALGGGGGGGMGGGALPAPPAPKPLPVGALKLQQEAAEAISIAGGIKADTAAITKQLDSGTLKLGPIKNLVSGARNFIGESSENSRNFASAKASLEKLRNDSLRLNKGTQTEGDAVRAWNELFANINDQEVVRKRLAEIQNINTRAINSHELTIKNIRDNYNAAPVDTSSRANVPPAVTDAANGKARPPLNAFNR